MTLKIADLFCGPGGLSHSFYNKGHQIAFAIDSDPFSIETFQRNHPDSKSEIICGNIEKIFRDKKSKILSKNKYDLVMGGPPCQGFSTANRQNIKNDPRNKLYKYFLKFVEATKPKFVLIENVVGIRKIAQIIIKDLDQIGYFSDFKIFQASDFGIPQNRRRTFFFGVSKKHYSLDMVDSFFLNLEKIKSRKNPHFLKDALYGLRPLKPHPKQRDSKNEIKLSGLNIEEISSYRSNGYIKLINYNRKPKFVFNHRARFNNDRDIKIFKTLPQGADSTHPSIQRIMPYKRRKEIFKDKYFKLSNNKICKTITAHMQNDCNMYIHPTQSRGLTPREAARVQSFSDQFFFVGPPSKCYRQIGNAVPPLLGRYLCESIENILS